jgi:hypothetical protein
MVHRNAGDLTSDRGHDDGEFLAHRTEAAITGAQTDLRSSTVIVSRAMV